MTSASQYIEALCATVPDFPQPGILFRDLSPVFADGAAFRALVDELAEPWRGRVDGVAGIEARGFVLAAAAAYALGTGVVIVRKPGKLPQPTHTRDYALEYGTATLELQAGDLPASEDGAAPRLLVLDDVLATGGTLEAGVALLEDAGAEVAGIGVVLELTALAGRARLGAHDLRVITRID